MTSRTDSNGRRHHTARTAEEIYPERDDLRDLRGFLPGAWRGATNLTNVPKKTIIRLTAEAARLKFGREVIVEF